MGRYTHTIALAGAERLAGMTHATAFLTEATAQAIAAKPRRKADYIRSEYLDIWRYAQTQRDMAQTARDSAEKSMQRDYCEGLFTGYYLAMDALKKARDVGEQLEWLLTSHEKREAERRMVGLPINFDISAGRYDAIVDIMERLERQEATA